MPTQIIASGSTAASSADLTMVAGTPITVSLKDVVDGNARVVLEIKSDAGAYNVISELTSHLQTGIITGPGVYRVSRIAGGTCGVFTG